MLPRERVAGEKSVCETGRKKKKKNCIKHVKHVRSQNFSMFCIKIFFITETRREQRNTRV